MNTPYSNHLSLARNMEDISTTSTSEVIMRHKIYIRERICEANFPDCCSYGPIHWEDPYKWQGVIFGPPESPYQDGVFFLSIDLPQDYPSSPPKVKFLTKVFHPNIDEDGTIYVDMLEEGQWSPIQTIESVLISLYSLMAEPDPVSFFNECCVLYQNNWDEFYKIAKEWTRNHAIGHIDQEDWTSLERG